MSNRYRLIWSILALMLASPVFALDCPDAKIIHVQLENNAVLVLQEGQNWHLVGYYAEAGTREKYAAILAAQMTGKRVIIRYPEGFNCAAYELSTSSLMVRTVN